MSSLSGISGEPVCLDETIHFICCMYLIQLIFSFVKRPNPRPIQLLLRFQILFGGQHFMVTGVFLCWFLSLVLHRIVVFIEFFWSRVQSLSTQFFGFSILCTSGCFFHSIKDTPCYNKKSLGSKQPIFGIIFSVVTYQD